MYINYQLHYVVRAHERDAGVIGLPVKSSYPTCTLQRIIHTYAGERDHTYANISPRVVKKAKL